MEVLQGAQRRAFERFKQDCEGVRVLRQISRGPTDPISTFAVLNRRLNTVHEVFERKRSLDERRRRGEITGDEHAAQYAALLREYGYPPGYALLDEESELKRARCAMSEYWFRDLMPPRRPVSPGACVDILSRFCAARDRLMEVRREIEQTKGRIEYERGRLARLRCDNWPAGARPPQEHARWCREVLDRIRALQQQQRELEARANGSRDELNRLGREYVLGCEGYPSCESGRPRPSRG